MNTQQRAMRLHDSLTCVGWVAGPEANALAYWSMRLADEIEGVGRYVTAYRRLRELAWENVRPFGVDQNAVSSQYAYEMQEFLRRHASRLPEKYRQCVEEIRKAMHSVATLPPVTGRVGMHDAAMAA